MVKKIIAHGSKVVEIDKLIPTPVFAGMGSNGSEFGEGIYSCDQEGLDLAKYYSTADGSIYLHEIETNNYLVVSDDNYLTLNESNMLSDYIDNIEDPIVKLRLSTDLVGRDIRYFDKNQEKNADEFYDVLEQQSKIMELPDRYYPDFEESVNGRLVVSFSRDEIDGSAIDKSTKDILDSIRRISPQLVSEIMGDVWDGIIVKSEMVSDIYVTFNDSQLVKELSAKKTNKEIVKWIDDFQLNQKKITFDIDSRPTTLYVFEDGHISDEKYGFDGLVEELYIEPRPHKKIFFTNINSQSVHLSKISELLLHSYPNWADASLRFDNNPFLTLSELVDKFKSDTDINKHILFHGTSSELLPLIAQKGLQSRGLSKVEPHYFNDRTKESLSDRVYFSNEFGLGCANAAARSAVSVLGGYPIILQFNVEAENYDYLVADEDSKKDNYHKSLSLMGTCAYLGFVSPEFLSIAPQRINSTLSFIELECSREMFACSENMFLKKEKIEPVSYKALDFSPRN